MVDYLNGGLLGQVLWLEGANMHYWGDEGVDWRGIGDAAEFIHHYCVRWARLGGDWKQKYGSVRFYCQFGLTLHNLIYPGHYFYRFPKWLTKFDIHWFTPVAAKLKLSWLWYKWQSFIYRQAYKEAIAKWPHLREEILGGADYPELLEGL